MVAGNWLILNKKHMLHLKKHIYSTEIACLDNRFWEEIITWAKRTRKVVLPHQKSASKVKCRRRSTMNQLFFLQSQNCSKKGRQKKQHELFYVLLNNDRKRWVTTSLNLEYLNTQISAGCRFWALSRCVLPRKKPLKRTSFLQNAFSKGRLSKKMPFERYAFSKRRLWKGRNSPPQKAASRTAIQDTHSLLSCTTICPRDASSPKNNFTHRDLKSALSGFLCNSLS